MTSLISLFSPISHGYSRNCITHQLEKVFLKVIFCFFFRSVFISIYGFSQTFWLNFIILWTFFKTNPWFNAYCKFLMCITYSVLSCKLATSFSTFSTFILSGKNDKSNQIKSNQTIYCFTWFLQILVYANKNKMAKYLQWKNMCGKTTCKETLYKWRPHNGEIKNKLN